LRPLSCQQNAGAPSCSDAVHGPLQLVDRLSVKAIFNRLDKRKLQNELDTHRLYLVTSHFDRLKAGGRHVEV